MKNLLPTVPKTGLAGLMENWRSDMVSGFLVFLIALPLCLGIALASGFPPMSGILTAIIGGLLVSRINGSHVTIIGPSAGLIVVVFASVQSLGQGDAMAGFRQTLAAIAVSGLLQVGLGVYKAGRLSALFPTAVIHGLLAAIGIIIMAKQIPVLVGVKPMEGSILAGIAKIPHDLVYFIPQITFIGLASLGILFAWPRVKHPILKRIPAPLVVIIAGVVFGKLFDLAHFRVEQDFIPPKDLLLGPVFLVSTPGSLWEGVFFPDFSRMGSLVFWENVVAITLVGSLESLLITSAIDLLDPYKRYSDLNRDLRALGIGNLLAGMIGGLPMIAEVVRSSANIDNGAKTGWSNFFHGLFLLLVVGMFPGLIDLIPLASLAALLIFAGSRLASPRTFAERLNLGKSQFAVFIITIAAAIATNLLAGVLIGIVAKLLITLAMGVPPKNLLRISYELERRDEATWVFRVSGSALFSNFISLKAEVSDLPDGQTVIFDLADAYLIDHTVRQFIDRFRQDYIESGGHCEIHGLPES